uniref:Uncharacterized protein n=1 Tax=Populus alba TaxID=43335 RepID=A0A4U5QUZ6_POPAL|nr:hypothetical protein D5086_0000060720 [Populus alba]
MASSLALKTLLEPRGYFASCATECEIELAKLGDGQATGKGCGILHVDFWQRFPFYGIDFGWGKPTWVTIPAGANKNVTTIMDTRDGEGVEAWVTLTEEDMAFFEGDRELLGQAASLDHKCPWTSSCPCLLFKYISK